MSDLRSKTIRLAAGLPVGDSTRRKLLQAVDYPDDREAKISAFVSDFTSEAPRHGWKVTDVRPGDLEDYRRISIRHPDGVGLQVEVFWIPSRGYGIKTIKAQKWREAPYRKGVWYNRGGADLMREYAEEYEDYEPPGPKRTQSMGAYRLWSNGVGLTVQGYFWSDTPEDRFKVVEDAVEAFVRMAMKKVRRGQILDPDGNVIDVGSFRVKPKLDRTYDVDNRGGTMNVMEIGLDVEPDDRLLWANYGYKSGILLRSLLTDALERAGFRPSRA